MNVCSNFSRFSIPHIFCSFNLYFTHCNAPKDIPFVVNKISNLTLSIFSTNPSVTQHKRHSCKVPTYLPLHIDGGHVPGRCEKSADAVIDRNDVGIQIFIAHDGSDQTRSNPDANSGGSVQVVDPPRYGFLVGCNNYTDGELGVLKRQDADMQRIRE